MVLNRCCPTGEVVLVLHCGLVLPSRRVCAGIAQWSVPVWQIVGVVPVMHITQVARMLHNPGDAITRFVPVLHDINEFLGWCCTFMIHVL